MLSIYSLSSSEVCFVLFADLWKQVVLAVTGLLMTIPWMYSQAVCSWPSLHELISRPRPDIVEVKPSVIQYTIERQMKLDMET